jgi:hypothetical protein
MQKREKITIAVGSGIVVVGLLVRLAMAGAGGGGGGAVEAEIAKIRSHNRLKASVEMKASELGIEIPRTDLTAQESAMRQTLSELSGRAGFGLGAVKRLESGRSASGAPATSVVFRFDGNGQFNDLMKFINEIEHSKVPYNIRELRVGVPQQGGGQQNGRRRGGGGEPGMVQASFEIESYLFHKVFPEAPKPAEDDKEKQG